MISTNPPSVCTGCSGEQCPCVCHRPAKRAALLINLGTPDSTEVRDVRRYLREFLADPFVIKLPRGWGWFTPALAAIIAQFRGPKSAKAYEEIWWEEGSPLKVITEQQVDKLQERLGGDWSVYYAMRYANPSIRDVVARMVEDGVTDLVVVPMYPQYAGPTTGTALEVLYRELRTQGLRFTLSIRNDWYDDRGYIESQAALLHDHIARAGLSHRDSYLLFSTHSMPASYIKQGDPYEGQIRRSMEMVLKRLGWPADRTSLSFQSKLGPVPWLAPATEDSLEELAERGEENVIVCPISFTADCLETLEEIGGEYAEMFEEKSEGGKLHLVPSLNDDDRFIDALASLVRRGPQRLPHDEPLEPLADSSAVESVRALADRLVMVGVAVPGSITDPAPAQEGLIDEEQLRAMGRERTDVLETIREVAAREGVDGCVAINTCQRCELYAIASRDIAIETCAEQVRDQFLRHIGDEAEAGPAVLTGADAFRRLLSNMLGLGSILPGELDAGDQTASAARMAEHAGTLSPGLRRIFAEGDRITTEIRQRTGWIDHARSFGDAALLELGIDTTVASEFVVVGGSVTSRKLLETRVPDEGRHTTLVHRGAARKDLIRFARRVAPHADRLCVDRYDDPRAIEAIAHADVVYLGVDTRQPVLRRSHLEGLRDFEHRPLVLVDFNSHGSTEDLGDLPGVRVISATDITKAARAYGERCMQDPKVVEIIAEMRRCIDTVAAGTLQCGKKTSCGGDACGKCPAGRVLEFVSCDVSVTRRQDPASRSEVMA